MSKEDLNSAPFIVLGKQLQHLREEVAESVAEVSGAIEIDESRLKRIEQGRERPSEDILLLLISHFSIRDTEAIRLWDLAGYDQPVMESDHEGEGLSSRPLVMVMTTDTRIIYSDSVQVMANANGVVLNFLQAPGDPYSPQTIARIGMSRVQAGKVLNVLTEALKQSSENIRPKQLPAHRQKTQKKQQQ